MPEVTIDEVLQMRFVNYSAPLELARRWLRSGDGQRHNDARRLLEVLFRRFSHSIEIGQQLALGYLEQGDRVQAQRVLDQIDFLCRNPQEEVLARRGRMAREEGDRNLMCRDGGPANGSINRALECYGLALKHYQAAWRVRGGHYPGINVATLHLMISSLEHQHDRQTPEPALWVQMAKSVLASRSHWPADLADDAVWHAATVGEAYLLLQDWPAAAESYRAAQLHGRFQPGHIKSIRPQVERILQAFSRLAVPDFGEFSNLDQVLPLAARESGVELG